MDIIDKIEMEEMLREVKEFYEDGEYNMEQIVELTGWTEKSAKNFGKTVGISPEKKGFFDKCHARMTGKFGDDGAAKFCASVKDKATGTTFWRGKGKKKIGPVSDKKK